MGDSHMTKVQFLPAMGIRPKMRCKSKIQLFLACLLVLLALIGLSRFCLVLKASALSLVIGQTICEVELIGREVVIGFFGYSL